MPASLPRHEGARIWLFYKSYRNCEPLAEGSSDPRHTTASPVYHVTSAHFYQCGMRRARAYSRRKNYRQHVSRGGCVLVC